MNIQEIEHNGAKITFMKDDASEITRHIWVNVNGKTTVHLIENKNGSLNVFRPELTRSICELCTSFERVKPQDIISFLLKKDFN